VDVPTGASAPELVSSHPGTLCSIRNCFPRPDFPPHPPLRAPRPAPGPRRRRASFRALASSGQDIWLSAPAIRAAMTNTGSMMQPVFGYSGHVRIRVLRGARPTALKPELNCDLFTRCGRALSLSRVDIRGYPLYH
jgi:hypothetical protein